MASRGVNKVILVGNLGADPEIRQSPNGSVVANLNIATGEAWKDQQGQLQERTEWHRVVMFGRTAEIARDYLRKGSKLIWKAVCKHGNGRIRTDRTATPRKLWRRNSRCWIARVAVKVHPLLVRQATRVDITRIPATTRQNPRVASPTRRALAAAWTSISTTTFPSSQHLQVKSKQTRARLPACPGFLLIPFVGVVPKRYFRMHRPSVTRRQTKR